MATSDPRVCLICHDNLDSKSDEYNKIGRKGLTSLVRFSNLHGDERLSKKLKELQKIDGPSDIYVHIKCRRDYTNQKRLRRNDGNEELNISQRRSGSVAFDWKSCCLFCGEVAVVDTKNPNRTIIHRCETLTMKETILARCNERADNWGNDVHYRLQDCIDLVANEAVYHLNCYRIFFLHRDTPKSTPQRQSEQQENFEKLCLWLDEQVELFTLTDLYDRMCASVDRDKVYSIKWFRMKLKEKYKETIFFTGHPGKPSLVCFKDSARDIISEKWFKERKQNIDEDKRRIIDAAARLIKSEIRSITFPTDVYPSKSDIENCSTFLPSSLQYFMELLIPSKLKQASIGQCILKAMKPNSVIPPLQFGLGVEVSNAMGSKWLNNELSRLGFALSYDEVLRFKQAVLLDKKKQIQNQTEGGFTQWVADNVDHNLNTLDGKGTFHGMGIISSSIEPTDWGWRQDNSCLVPVMSTQVFRLAVLFSKKAIPTIGVDSILGRCLLISI